MVGLLTGEEGSRKRSMGIPKTTRDGGLQNSMGRAGRASSCHGTEGNGMNSQDGSVVCRCVVGGDDLASGRS